MGVDYRWATTPGWRDQVTAFIGRREAITLVGGAAAAWSVVARAQQVERMRRIGVLMHGTSDEPESQGREGQGSPDMIFGRHR